MKVTNMTSSKGNKVANQFIINDGHGNTYFQSYKSIIVKEDHNSSVELSDGSGRPTVYLDSVYWDYSVTTNRYRNQFLGETKKETQAKIDSGEYILTDLN